VSRDEFASLVAQCQNFSSRETASELAKQISELRKLAKEKLVYIEEMEKQDESVRKWCSKTYSTRESFEKQQLVVEN
jgi:hypothetical protein